MKKTIIVEFPDDFKFPTCEKCPFICTAEVGDCWYDGWCCLTDKYCESIFDNKDKCPFFNGAESYDLKFDNNEEQL